MCAKSIACHIDGCEIKVRGLLDELFVQIGSVTLGAGKPLLPRSITMPPLRLISVKAIGTGFAELHYEVPPHAASIKT